MDRFLKTKERKTPSQNFAEADVICLWGPPGIGKTHLVEQTGGIWLGEDTLRSKQNTLEFIGRVRSADRAVIIDAIRTGAPPGTIHRLRPDAMATQRSASAHDVSLPTALEFGRRAGARLPADHDILLVAVEVEDILNFGEQCTPAVAAAVVPAARAVLQALGPPCTNCPSSKP